MTDPLAGLAEAFPPPLDPEVVDWLREIAEADPDDRETAVDPDNLIINLEVVYPETVAALPFLGRFAEHGDRAVPLLGQIAHIAKSTRGSADEVERAAFAAAVAQGPVALRRIGSPSPEVRRAAAEALPELLDAPLALPALVERWNREQDASVKASVLDSIGRSDRAEALGLSRDLLSAGASEQCTVVAVQLLAEEGVEWTSAMAGALLDSLGGYWEARRTHYYSMCEPFEAVVTALVDRDAWRDALALVAAGLGHADATVRRICVFQAKTLCETFRSASAALLDGLTAQLSDPEVEEWAADLLSDLRVRSTADALAAAASIPGAARSHFRCRPEDTALKTLLLIGDPRGPELLALHLTRRPWALRVADEFGLGFDAGLLDAIRTQLRRLPTNEKAFLRSALPADFDVFGDNGKKGTLAMVSLLASWGPAARPAVPELEALRSISALQTETAIRMIIGLESVQPLRPWYERPATLDNHYRRATAVLALIHAHPAGDYPDGWTASALADLLLESAENLLEVPTALRGLRELGVEHLNPGQLTRLREMAERERRYEPLGECPDIARDEELRSGAQGLL